MLQEVNKFLYVAHWEKVNNFQLCIYIYTHTRVRVLQSFFRHHPGEPVPEEKLYIIHYRIQFSISTTTSGISPAKQLPTKTSETEKQ